MENKYYTPDISDLHIGYEMEFYDIDDNNWNPTIIDSQPALCNWTGLDIPIRTPYLTSEQIEKEGWIISPDYSSKDIFDKGNWWIRFRSEEMTVQFVVIDPTKIEWTQYSEFVRILLPCRSINEFRQITKMLQIK